LEIKNSKITNTALYKEKLAKNKAKLTILKSDIKDSIFLLASDPTNHETELSLQQMEIERNNILKVVGDQWSIDTERGVNQYQVQFKTFFNLYLNHSTMSNEQ
jgi:hypothetical protein